MQAKYEVQLFLDVCLNKHYEVDNNSIEFKKKKWIVLQNRRERYRKGRQEGTGVDAVDDVDDNDDEHAPCDGVRADDGPEGHPRRGRERWDRGEAARVDRDGEHGGEQEDDERVDYRRGRAAGQRRGYNPL